MKKILLIGFLFVLNINCAVYKPNTYPPADIIKYMNTITAGELKTHLTIVASDEMQGRDTGSKGQKKAGEYLISQYKKKSNSVSKRSKRLLSKNSCCFFECKK